MNYFLAILAVILTLLLVVGIHEAGHALAAYFFKVKIKRLSIGFGKPVFTVKRDSGCEWVLSRWPLGGYVLLLNTRIEPVSEADHPLCFDKKPVGVRILILLAGAFANIIVAWLALIVVFTVGLTTLEPVVETVTPNSIAALAGIKAGDRIMNISGHNTPSWRDIDMRFIVAIGKQSIPVIIKRQTEQTETVYLTMHPEFYSHKRKSLLENMGIHPLTSAAKVTLSAPSLVQAIYQANNYIVDTVIFMTLVLKQLLTGMIAFSLLLGPLGLLALTAMSLSQGIMLFLFFIASFNIAVAFINLFPLPSLDGGSIVYAGIEKIRGKPISVALEVLLHRLVFIALVVLLVNLLGNDLRR